MKKRVGKKGRGRAVKAAPKGAKGALLVTPRDKPIAPRVVPRRVGPATPAKLDDASDAKLPASVARAEAERLVKDARKLGTEIASAFYRLGVVLRDLARPERYRALGYETFGDLLEERDITTRMTAYRLISVVDAFEEKTAQELGVEKGYAVIRYAALAHPDAAPVDVLRRDPVIRAGLEARRLSIASSRDVFAAIRDLQRPSVSDAYVKRVQRASRGISQRLEHIDIHTAKVRSVKRGDRVVVRVEIDGSEAERFLALLRSK